MDRPNTGMATSDRRVARCLCACLAALMLSCSRSSQTPIAKTSADRLSQAVPPSRYADDVGRFLAGMPAKPGSPFKDLEEQPSWARHRRTLDAAWSRLERDRLPAMRAFQKTELSSARIAGSPVFYPFSGPDALMLAVFFPASPTYILAGLEPAGTLPARKRFARKDLDEYLSTIRSTLASELGRSFFITREMDRQFRGQVTDGLFLPILELLVRTGHTILGYRYVRLSETGEIVVRAPDYRAPGVIGNKGVEIDFRTDDDRSIHKLLYFSVNLSDERLKQDAPFLKFLSSLKGATTFFKATSYMVHKPEFSIIREEVLSKSAFVLQDDSGIPYHCFGASSWRVQLYGEYDRPYGSFRWFEQKDLKKAYAASGIKALDFRIGYGYGRVPSNLQLAAKTN